MMSQRITDEAHLRLKLLAVKSRRTTADLASSIILSVVEEIEEGKLNVDDLSESPLEPVES